MWLGEKVPSRPSFADGGSLQCPAMQGQALTPTGDPRLRRASSCRDAGAQAVGRWLGEPVPGRDPRGQAHRERGTGGQVPRLPGGRQFHRLRLRTRRHATIHGPSVQPPAAGREVSTVRQSCRRQPLTTRTAGGGSSPDPDPDEAGRRDPIAHQRSSRGSPSEVHRNWCASKSASGHTVACRARRQSRLRPVES